MAVLRGYFPPSDQPLLAFTTVTTSISPPRGAMAKIMIVSLRAT
jgi:hypothetical protein